MRATIKLKRPITDINVDLDENPIEGYELMKWVPVSERLPEGQTTVIVSVHDDRGDSPFDYTECGWITTDGEYWIVDNEINNHVVAWMPLPEPWRGEGS